MFRKDLKDGRYRTSLMVFAIINIALMSGTILGWANIVVVLRMEGLYSHLCPRINTTQQQQQQQQQHSNSTTSNNCPAQDQMLNLIFTISVNCFAASMLPGGFLIDKHGPFVASVVSGVIYLVGAFCFSFSSVGRDYLLFPAFIFLGFGGNLQVKYLRI